MCLGDLRRSQFVEGTPEEPNYLLFCGKKVYRLNVMGIVVYKETIGSVTMMMIDDSSGTCPLRFFEQSSTSESILVGECICVVGRPRSYNGETYVSPEIARKVEPLWVKVRSLECAGTVSEPENTVLEREEVIPENAFPAEKIHTIIKELDTGSGVLTEDILEHSPFPDTEQLLAKMMEKGDIFQIAPGRIKVL